MFSEIAASQNIKKKQPGSMATFMLFFRLDTKKLQIVVMFYLFVFCVNCQFGAVLLVVNGNFNPKNTTATRA